MKKKCTCCEKEKDIGDFCANKNSSDGYHYYCRECNKNKAKQWRKKNSNKVKQYNRAHLAEHREWEERNRERVRERQRAWDHRNRKKESERKKVYYHQRFYDDPLFKYKMNCRNIIYQAVYRTNPYKNSTKMSILLGCSYETLRKHLLQTWEDRYQKQYIGEKFNIDHIIPLYMAKDEESVRRLCHYTNLQLLTPEDNAKKGKSLILKQNSL